MLQGCITVIGLGYVGLPLAVEFSAVKKVIGFDVDGERIVELAQGFDRTKEIGQDLLNERLKTNLRFTSDQQEIVDSNVYIVAVPTPVGPNYRPNLESLRRACFVVGGVLDKDDLVVFESTVYPGATEEFCVPILERCAGLSHGTDFHVGYSPERINPGDKLNTLKNIKKITAGSTERASKLVDDLYNLVISAGTHVAPSIKVAEAAKVFENVQRDVNIALVNELSNICHRLQIDTMSVLDAASTKWNFMKYSPGLVGGHCVGIDPYYLIDKAEKLGVNPFLMKTARDINENMSIELVDRLMNAWRNQGINPKGYKVLLLGITFKEDVPDIRNTQTVKIFNALVALGITVEVFDPCADRDKVLRDLKIELLKKLPEDPSYDAVVLIVPHEQFIFGGVNACKTGLKRGGIFFDVKAVFETTDSDLRL